MNKKIRTVLTGVILCLGFFLTAAGTKTTAETEGDIQTREQSDPGIMPAAGYQINIGTISAGGSGYTYAGNVLTFTAAADGNEYTITGTSTPKDAYNRIVIEKDITVKIILQDLYLEHDIYAPIILNEGAAVEMILNGTNTLICSADENTEFKTRKIAGLNAAAGTSINICGTGFLEVRGGCSWTDSLEEDYIIVRGAAGIGGGIQEGGGEIVIAGEVTIEAYGGGVSEEAMVYAGAGIGGGLLGNGGNITIEGTADVTAEGGGYSEQSGYGGGAGIGSGYRNNGFGDMIIIRESARVKAAGGGRREQEKSGSSDRIHCGGAGIGTGGTNNNEGGFSSEIYILGNAEVEAYGGGEAKGTYAARGGAGIGGGGADRGKENLAAEDGGGLIAIGDQVQVKAVGSGTASGSNSAWGGAGIGSGANWLGEEPEIRIYGSARVESEGGGLAASGTVFGGAGIGGGYLAGGGTIFIEGSAEVTAEGGGEKTETSTSTVSGAAGIGGGANSPDGGTITIRDSAQVTAAGGGISAGSNAARGGAGIGGGGTTLTENSAAGGNIRISGSSQVYAGGGGTAAGTNSGWGGAGIGGGAFYGDGGFIQIEENARVTAVGGGQAVTGNLYSGAGIGGGYFGSGGKIELTGGSITAKSGGSAKGGGKYPACGIGWGYINSSAYQKAYIMIGADTEIEVYGYRYRSGSCVFPAIGTDAVSGTGYFTNAYLTTGPLSKDSVSVIDVFDHQWAVRSVFPGKLELPAGYECFAFTTGNSSAAVNLEASDVIVHDDPDQDVAVCSSRASDKLWPLKLGYTVSFSIEKYLDEEAVTDQSFVFQIDYRETNAAAVSRVYYGTGEIAMGQTSGTIDFKELPPGEYDIYELDSNWKYDADISGGFLQRQTDVLDWKENAYIDTEFKFYNSFQTNNLINGSDYARNILEALD